MIEEADDDAWPERPVDTSATMAAANASADPFELLLERVTRVSRTER